MGRHLRPLHAALLLACACEIVDPGPEAGVAQRCAVAPEFFLEEVHPKLIQKHACRSESEGGCHDANTGTSIYRLHDVSDVLKPAPTDPLPVWPEPWQLNFEETAAEIHDCDIGEQSPLYRKPSGVEPHGGGKQFSANGPELDLIENWLATAQ